MFPGAARLRGGLIGALLQASIGVGRTIVAVMRSGQDAADAGRRRDATLPDGPDQEHRLNVELRPVSASRRERAFPEHRERHLAKWTARRAPTPRVLQLRPRGEDALELRVEKDVNHQA